MGQESEYRKEDKKEEGAGGEMGGRGEEGRMGRGGEPQRRTLGSSLLTSVQRKAF